MTLEELERVCIGAHVARQRRLTISIAAGAKWSLGFPRGELLSVNAAAGVRNYSVDPLKVLMWLREGWPK
jgi:hypothetical protein